jgi:hypothetical protein
MMQDARLKMQDPPTHPLGSKNREAVIPTPSAQTENFLN